MNFLGHKINSNLTVYNFSHHYLYVTCNADHYGTRYIVNLKYIYIYSILFVFNSEKKYPFFLDFYVSETRRTYEYFQNFNLF